MLSRLVAQLLAEKVEVCRTQQESARLNDDGAFRGPLTAAAVPRPPALTVRLRAAPLALTAGLELPLFHWRQTDTELSLLRAGFRPQKPDLKAAH